MYPEHCRLPPPSYIYPRLLAFQVAHPRTRLTLGTSSIDLSYHLHCRLARMQKLNFLPQAAANVVQVAPVLVVLYNLIPTVAKSIFR